MPELENVQPQKTAGFVDVSARQARNRAKLEREEKELEELIKAQRGEAPNEEQEAEPDGEGSEATEVQETSGSKQEEANTEAEAQEDDSELNAEEKSFKKRYGDLRRHMNEKEKEWKNKLSELEDRIKAGPEKVRPPKSDEDIAAWAKKYPDVASIVETIAAKKAQELFAGAQERFKELDEAKWEAERTKAENAIRKVHSDFDDLKSSDEFHDWADSQPKWVKDALYENADDPASVIRVIDLYKVDNGLTPSARKQDAKKAAATVSKGSRTQIDADSASGTFRESQVAKMSPAEYEAKADKIDQAIRNGKFVYDLSGAAR
jgi:anti-sigma28 factor (negative regulator of flagellin synthesis)